MLKCEQNQQTTIRNTHETEFRKSRTKDFCANEENKRQKNIEEIFCDLIEWKEEKLLFHNESERKNEWMNSWIAWDTVLQKEEKKSRKKPHTFHFIVQ